jgi:hypothetical protein
MLDFDPFAPVYPSHVQDNDSLLRFKAMQADPIAYSPYSPPPIPLGKFAYNSPPTPPTPPSASSGLQSFTFDPFADEDSSTSSVASERERELVVERLRRIEFLRRREWMRRVVAWVDGISQDTVSDTFPSFDGIRRWFLISAKPKVQYKTINTDMNLCLIHRAPHYHRPLRCQCLLLPLDLIAIPNNSPRPIPRIRPLFITVRVRVRRRKPAVRTRTRNLISSIALPSPARRKRPFFPHPHHHRPLYQSLQRPRLFIPLQCHRRIYPLLPFPHRHGAFTAVCAH